MSIFKKLFNFLSGFEPEMILVEGGNFVMGDNDMILWKAGGQISSSPQHNVSLDSYYIGKYPVTFKEFDKFCSETYRSYPRDEGWGRAKRPVINVNFQDAIFYCEWLSKKTGYLFRLPTEAEWEYAARGGKKSKDYMYSGSNNIAEVSHCESNAATNTLPVGKKSPNELGLYDMSGNVFEWCADWAAQYSELSQRNPLGPISGYRRIIRGGSWYNYSRCCRVDYRADYDPFERNNNFGFRIVKELNARAESKVS